MLKTRVARPWLAIHNPSIAWDRRTYCLNLSTGMIQVLYEKWFSQTDMQGNTIKPQKVMGTLENPDKYPELTMEQVERIFKQAEADDCALKYAFGKVIGVDGLSKADLARVAACPDCFAENPVMQVAEKVEVTEQVIAKFISDISPAVEPVVGKAKRPATPAGI